MIPESDGYKKSAQVLNLGAVALEGFEPPQAEPESDVLPLHHKARFIGGFAVAKVWLFFELANVLCKKIKADAS